MDKALRRRYYHIKERCYNPNSKAYKRYGGRGIKMCDEWLNDYELFEKWALSHGYEQHLAIDRINNDGNYSPDNCRFVTPKENNQNRRTTRFYTINGVTKNLQQWCDTYHMQRYVVETRLKSGCDIETALTKPITKGRDKTSLIGKRFGRLIVTGYAGDEYVRSNNESKWMCQCDCGNTAIVGRNKLQTGHTQSCGCLVSEKARTRMLNDNPMKQVQERKV